MSYENSILNIKYKNYYADITIDSNNFDTQKANLYVRDGNDYIPVAESSFESTTIYYKYREWLQIPAIKGTSATISAYATSETTGQGVTKSGYTFVVKNESLTEPSVATYTIWNGANGSGAIDTVDDIAPATGERNVVLGAVSYRFAQDISIESQLTARKNIGALATTLTINGVSITNPSESNASVTLVPSNINAVHGGVTINGVSITNASESDATITLTPSNINAVHGGFTINGVSITNPSESSATITLTPQNIGAVHSGFTINGVSITNPSESSATITLTPQNIEAVHSALKINNESINYATTSAANIFTRFQTTGVTIASSAWASLPDSSALESNNAVILTSDQVSALISNGFNYYAPFNLTWAKTNYTPIVTFGIDEAMSGNFAPIAATGSNQVFVFAQDIPETETLIESAVCLV